MQEERVRHPEKIKLRQDLNLSHKKNLIFKDLFLFWKSKADLNQECSSLWGQSQVIDFKAKQDVPLNFVRCETDYTDCNLHTACLFLMSDLLLSFP